MKLIYDILTLQKQQQMESNLKVENPKLSLYIQILVEIKWLYWVFRVRHLGWLGPNSPNKNYKCLHIMWKKFGYVSNHWLIKYLTIISPNIDYINHP